MANVKISQLPAASSSLLTDEIPVVQGTDTKRETLSQVATLFNSNLNFQQANGAATYDLTSGDVTVSNPCPTIIIAGSTNPGRKILLPAMNQANSLKGGTTCLIIYNNNTQSITVADSSGATIITVPASNRAFILIRDNSSQNGSAIGFILGTLSAADSPLSFTLGGTQATSLAGAQTNLQIIGLQNSELFFQPANTNGMVAGQSSFANGANYPYLQAQNATTSYTTITVQMPKRWNQNSFQLLTSWYTPATTGTLQLTFDAAIIDLSSSLNITFGSAVSSSSPAPSSANVPTNILSPAIIPSGIPLDYSVLVIRIYRIAGSGSDTLANSAFLINPIRLIWTASAGNDQ